MSATRKPASQDKKSVEQKKSIQVFKTAVPLLITTALLALVYLFVLTPAKPINVLKSALTNTFDAEKQKSLRYDGSFGDENNDLQAEFNGQKGANGDKSFALKITHKETSSASFGSGNVSETSYIRVEGVDKIPVILAAIPGAKPLDPEIQNALSSVDGKWISLSVEEQTVLSSSLPCSKEVEQLFGDYTLNEQEEFPFDIVAGPYSDGDGSVSETYEVELRVGRKVTDTEQSITGALNCLDSLRGDDYRLREVNQSDIDAFRLKISVDPLSNTIKRISYKQSGIFFQIFLRDFNKDISVAAPTAPISLTDALSAIPVETRLRLLQNAIPVDL